MRPARRAANLARGAAGSAAVAAAVLLAVVAAAVLLAAPAAGLAAQLQIDSGPLRATISTDPWSLRFTQASGDLVETGGAAASPYGTLGFGAEPTPPWGGAPSSSPGSSWWHATRVLTVTRTAHGLKLLLATNDPLGRQIQVTVVPAGPGILALHAEVSGGSGTAGVTQMAESFLTPGHEHFSGFGGRENATDFAGQTVEDWSAEGNWTPADRPFIPGFIEPWTDDNRDDGAYFPMPWLASSRGYGFLLDDSERSLFRLASDRPDAWDVEVDAAHLDYRVFAGPRPLDVVRRFSAAVGRQPHPAAPWVLGPWWQPTGPDSATLPQRFRHDDVPGSLIMTYTHYLPGGGQNDQAERVMVQRMHAGGYAVTTYFNPMVSVEYQPVFSQAQSAGVLLDNELGQPYPIHYNQYAVAEFDFTTPAGRSFYQGLLRQAVANGYDGWMEDFGEYTPPDVVAHDGTPGSALHNAYPRLYHCAAYALTSMQRRPVIEFDRSGWTGSAACTPVVWSGDPTTDWDPIDGLPAMVSQGLNYGYSGLGFYGSDVGGFFSITAPPPTDELLARWLELGAFSGVMRTESEGFTAPQWTQPRAQIWDPQVEPIWRRYAKLRTQLYPYLAAAAARYERDGVPLMESLGLAYPADPASWQGPARYLFGPSLLVAPVTGPGVRSAAVPVPPGRWRDFWRSVTYRPGDGSFHLRRAPTLAGGATAHVAAPLEQIPLFVRDGTLLPLLPPDVATLAAYGRGVVHLSDRRGRLHLLAWPRRRSSATALGTRFVSSVSRRRWSLTIGGGRPASIAVEALLPWRPREVTFRGLPLGRGAWGYGGGVLSVALRGAGRLEVIR